MKKVCFMTFFISQSLFITHSIKLGKNMHKHGDVYCDIKASKHPTEIVIISITIIGCGYIDKIDHLRSFITFYEECFTYVRVYVLGSKYSGQMIRKGFM